MIQWSNQHVHFTVVEHEHVTAGPGNADMV